MAVKGALARRRTWTLPRRVRGLLALVLVAGALAVLISGLAQTSTRLVVADGGQRYELRTHATTVGSALHNAGFDLHPEDLVLPGLEEPLRTGLVVEVQRAQTVVLKADAHMRQVRTQAQTVGALLAEVGVQLGPADEIWLEDQLVGPETYLRAGNAAPRTVSHRGERPATSEDRALQPVQKLAGDPPLITVRRAASLILDDNGLTTTLHTTLSTVGQVIEANRLSLFLGDEVTPNLQARVESGMMVTIRRSMPVEIVVDGRVVKTRTRASDVAGVLGQEGVALVAKDTVRPSLDVPIRPNMVIRVTRVREEFVVEFEPIPFQTELVPDPEVEIDNIRLVRDGQVGLTKRRYRLLYEDNAVVERVLEDIWEAQPPITKTLAYGTKIVVRTLDTADGPIEYWRKIRVYTTSYMPRSCGKPKDHPRYGYTALGLKLRRGIVAVDPTVIPLRSKMYVPGYGPALAGDTGGGVKGKFVDLGFSDDDYESWHWWTDIYLLTPVPPASKIRWVLPNWPRYPDRKR